jgi:acetyl-CoA carboxylase biotin carboxyl carrier protein
MTLKDDVKQLGALLTNGTKPKAIDATAIRELADLLSETGLSEIEIEQDGTRIRVARQTSAVAYTPQIQSVHLPSAVSTDGPAAKREGPHPGAIPSPMVGTVYVSPQPGAAPFVKVGDAVKEGDTLLIVEAMKTMNPISAPRSGTVSEICVADSEPVEFGQTLLIIT